MWDDKKKEELVQGIKKVQERYWERILRRIRELGDKTEKTLTLELLRSWCDQEVRLPATEAKAYGLIDEVRALSEILRLDALGG
jgi:ATP-dependent protease ClpP protease subunit